MVAVAEPGKMHLVGHFLRAVLERNLRAGARVPRGSVGVRAGRMELTLSGDGERVRLSVGIAPEARAVVSGALSDFLAIARGRGVLRPLLSGRVRLRGNPLALLPWLGLLRVPEAGA